jgi:acetylornithine deacetylase/succinyl-diaminopimelate desuccinylase-like protein
MDMRTKLRDREEPDSMNSTDRPLEYADHNRPRFVEELGDFIRFPSVSGQPEHANDLKKCASWLANHLRHIGMEPVRIVPTRGHPIVYAEWRHNPQRPTVLIYGHYDVQPVDPLNEWNSRPFEPTVRGGDLHGRGASDDKGQLFTHVKALEAYLQSQRALPVNVKCLFEGEEEIGSPSLTPFLCHNKNAFAADVAVLSDMLILAPNRPAITYALRGALSLELEVRGSALDLHSGNFGGVVHNPLQALCEIVASLHDSDGRVAIAGFYDRVREWSAKERAYMASTGPSDTKILKDAQSEAGWGEEGYTLYERATIRPSIAVNGIVGGYQGPGIKAVIPARAAVKLNFRLVPDQDPSQIEQLLREHVARFTPRTVRSTTRTQMLAKPAFVDRQHPAMRAAAVAYWKSFGAAPVFLRSGGTIPVVNLFQEMLGIPTVLMGFALPDDRMHAPNEKFHLPNFYKGIATSINFLNEIGARTQQIDAAGNVGSMRRVKARQGELVCDY